MKIDIFTKGCLAVISLSLVAIAIQPLVLPKESAPQVIYQPQQLPYVQKIALCNIAGSHCADVYKQGGSHFIGIMNARDFALGFGPVEVRQVR